MIAIIFFVVSWDCNFREKGKENIYRGFLWESLAFLASLSLTLIHQILLFIFFNIHSWDPIKFPGRLSAIILYDLAEFPVDIDDESL